jgi:hypothetical protein
MANFGVFPPEFVDPMAVMPGLLPFLAIDPRFLEFPGAAFPTQYLGLRAFFQGAVKDLCLVDVANAPAGMGGIIKINKVGTIYAVYLVETTDPDASPLRIQTSTGIKAIRLKT